MNAPRYAVYFMLDEPHGNKSTGGFSTAGAVSAPAAGRVIAKIAPMLGLLPDTEHMAAIQAMLSIPLQPPHGYVARWPGPLNFVPPSVPLSAPPLATAPANAPLPVSAPGRTAPVLRTPEQMRHEADGVPIRTQLAAH
jgi:cell division protein FtsI (penicillin-binding protein 3)